MTFKQFVHAIKSTWSAASNVTILLAVLAGIGVSSVWSEVPSSVSMVACLLFYLAGFLASCYRSADEAMRAKKAHEEEIAGKNAEMKAMRADFAKNLAFAEENAKSVLAQDGEDLALVMLRQDFLSGLASIDSAERRQEYVVERLTGSVKDNERFGAAFRDLEKYGCVGGSRTVYSPKKGFSTAFYPDGPFVLRTDYPSLRERERRDIVIEARDEAIREFERKSAERRRREMM